MTSLLFAHRPVVLIGSLIVGVGLLTAHPTLSRSIHAGLEGLPLSKKEVAQERAKKIQEAQQHSEMLRRIAVKDSIIEELLANRITLAEATDQFTEINENQPDCMARIRAAYPGQTDREKMARNVIGFAAVQAKPEEWPAVHSRLEGELQLMLNQSGAE